MLDYDLIRRLPSLIEFGANAASSLLEGKSLIVRVPQPEKRAIVTDLVQGLVRQETQGFKLQSLYLPDLPPDPLQALAQGLDIAWAQPDRPRTREHLQESDGLPDILCLLDLEQLPDKVQQSWAELLRRWHDHCPQTSVCLVLAAQTPRLTEITKGDGWQVWDWQGIPTPVELQLLCQLLSRRNQDGPAQRTWRQHILPALIGSEWELLDLLWEDVLLGPDALLAPLCTYGLARGWSADLFREWQLEHLLEDPSTANPGELDRAFAAGILEQQDPIGLLVHPAALALLDLPDALAQRFWQGQIAGIMPLLNNVRWRMSRTIAGTLGSGWPAGIKLDNEPNGLELEHKDQPGFGRIIRALHQEAQLGGYREIWQEAAVKGCRMRNLLAHYQPVSFADFQHWLAAAYRANLLD